VDEAGCGGAQQDCSRQERRAAADSFPVAQENLLGEEYAGRGPNGFQ
jgi:hypothetical protein